MRRVNIVGPDVIEIVAREHPADFIGNSHRDAGLPVGIDIPDVRVTDAFYFIDG